MYAKSSITIVLLLFTTVRAFYRFYDLETASELDEITADVLTKSLEAMENCGEDIKEYLDEYKLLDELENEDGVTQNPLLIYQMLRRVVVNRKEAANCIRKMAIEALKGLETITMDHELRLASQMMEAAERIVKLQDAYQLQPKHLMETIDQFILQLTVFDCMTLAEVSKRENRTDLRVEWTQEAHKMCLKYSMPIYCTHTLRLYEAAKLKLMVFPVTTSPTGHHELCSRGNPPSHSNRRCHYPKRPGDVYFTLCRFQVEVHSITPLIVTVYNAINPLDIELMQLTAMDNFEAWQLMGEAGPRSDVWTLSEHDHSVFGSVTNRIAYITQLNVEQGSAQPFQIQNHMVGEEDRARYDFPSDFLKRHQPPEKLLQMANGKYGRLATAKIYLSNVEEGGATAFPRAKVAVQPQKGAVTLWMNLKVTSGAPDEDSLHLDCPVLLGTKWVAIKWILFRGQMCHTSHPFHIPETSHN